MTKKVIYMFLCFLICINTSSCYLKKNFYIKPDEIVTNFSAQFAMDYNDIKYVGIFKNDEFNTSKIEIQSPEELQGLIFSHDLEGYKVIKNNLILSCDNYFLAENSPTNILLNVMSNLNTHKDKLRLISSDEENSIFEGSVSNFNYLISVQNNTGLIENIVINDLKLSYNFHDISY